MNQPDTNARAIRVLFVDDEPLTCKYFASSVDDDYEVITATDAHSALSLLQDNLIDILVTDYRMPGVHGGRLLSTVSQQFPHTICIMATAYADKESLLETINTARLFYILEKPINKEILKNVLYRATQQIKGDRLMSYAREANIDSSLTHQLSGLLVHIIDLSVSMQLRIQTQQTHHPSNEPLTQEYQALLESIAAIRQNAEYASQVVTKYTPSRQLQ